MVRQVEDALKISLLTPEGPCLFTDMYREQHKKFTFADLLLKLTSLYKVKGHNAKAGLLYLTSTNGATFHVVFLMVPLGVSPLRGWQHIEFGFPSFSCGELSN